MRNVNGGLVADHVVELFVDLRLGDRVERGGRLVENEEGRILIERAGDGDLLPLAAGDLDTVLVKIAEEARLRSERQRFEPLSRLSRGHIPARRPRSARARTPEAGSPGTRRRIRPYTLCNYISEYLCH